MHYPIRHINLMSSRGNPRRPRLERRNAIKHFDYEASTSSSADSSFTSPPASRHVRSFEYPDRTSFRIEGNEGEFDQICRSLGLAGIEDFAIPESLWEERKNRSLSDLLPTSKLGTYEWEEESEADGVLVEERVRSESTQDESALPDRARSDVRVKVRSELGPSRFSNQKEERVENESTRDEAEVGEDGGDTFSRDAGVSVRAKNTRELYGPVNGGGVGGIKGDRPSVLKPPPSMRAPVIDVISSTWDIFRDFAPVDERENGRSTTRFGGSSFSGEEEEAVETEEKEKEEKEQKVMVVEGKAIDRIEMEEEEEEEVRNVEAVVTSEGYFTTTTNDDDSSSSTVSNISPSGRLRRTISEWQKGGLLGSGSFGSVYEGISEDGFFFAVKEVSLLDQGDQGRQRIIQLEHEIDLLSQFEHENIVQYYGTDKDESNLYIFLELVTKGSLASLYQKYHLRDSQVSAYTRQILHGLKYLHDRNLIHRDIKCANILVDASGSVKLADFGLAKLTKFNDIRSCKGTAFWMAPEVVKAKHLGYGRPADIWSLGCTVLEMLTQRFPYSHLEWMSALFAIGKGERPLIPDSLSSDAQDFILKCLQVNPNDRPTSAQLLNHPFVQRPSATSSGSGSPYHGRRS